MRHLVTLMRTVAVAVAVLALATGCAASAPSAIEVGDATVVVDVRTPSEYAEGHLEGAVNLDLQSGRFEQEIAGLPTDGDYVVYCRSGNRSAQAAAIMKDAGFAAVRDAGGLQDAAAATGLAIVVEG